MNSENISTLTASPSEETFTILDLQALSQRAEAAEEVNDNARRISLAASALLHFADQTGLGDSTEPADTAVTDLLTDIMHLCAHCWPVEGAISFVSVLNTARMHFDAECNEHPQWDFEGSETESDNLLTLKQFSDLADYLYRFGVFSGLRGIQGYEFQALTVIDEPTEEPEGRKIYIRDGYPFAVYDFDTGYTVLRS